MYGLAMAMNRYLSEGKKPDRWLAGGGTKNQAGDRGCPSLSAAQWAVFDELLRSLRIFARHRPANEHERARLRVLGNGHDRRRTQATLDDRGGQCPVRLFEETREMPVECASLYHAAHGLKLYRLRRFGPPEAVVSEPAKSQEAPASQAVAPNGESATLAR